jgi:hypothetical protein
MKLILIKKSGMKISHYKFQYIRYLFGSSILFLLFIGCKPGSFLSEVKHTPFYYDGHIYVKAKVNSVDCILDMDTGAEVLYLDSTFFYKKIDSTLLVDYTIGGVGTQKRKTKIYTDIVLYSLANHAKSQLYTPILDLQNLAKHRSDGIFGYHFMENKVICIDFVNRLLHIGESTHSFLLEDFQKIPFELKESKIIIEAVIQFTKDFSYRGKFVVDTGSDNSLNFTSATADSLSLDTIIKNKIQRESIAMGIGKYSSNFSFKIPKAFISKFTIQDLISEYSTDNSGALSKSLHYDGIIGNSILKRFDIIIDYKSQNLYLKPNKKFLSKDDDKQYMYSLVQTNNPRKGWLVFSKVMSEETDNYGLQLGDIITHLNSQSVNDLKSDKFIKLFKDKKRKLLTVYRNGTIVELTIDSIQLALK